MITQIIKTQRVAVTCGALFLLNFISGLSLINEGLFHYDSVMLARAVENTSKTGHLHPAVSGRYGAVIVNSILHLPFFLKGQNADFTTRFSSVLFHALSIVVFFLFLYKLFADFIQAVFAALLLSFTPLYFSPNTYGKEHGMSMFFIFFAFYLLESGIQQRKPQLIGIASFIYAFAISVREAAIFLLPLYLLLYLSPEISISPLRVKLDKEKIQLKPLAWLGLPFVIPFCVIYFTYLKTEIYHTTVARAYSAPVYLGPFSWILKVVIKDLYGSIPMLLLFFFPLGVWQMFREIKNIFLPLFFILWCMLIFYFGNIWTYSPRYLDIAIISVYVFVSYVLSALYVKDKKAALIIIFYFVFSMFIFMCPMLSFRHHYNGEKQFALFVKEKTEDDAVIITMDDAAFIEYYGNRKAMGHPADDSKSMQNFLREIVSFLANQVPVYITESGFSYDHSKLFYKTIFDNLEVVEVGTKLSEDYHRPELEFWKYNQRLFKIYLKK